MAPANAGLLDKFFLTTPVLFAIRISIIFVAFGIVLLIATTLWKGVSISKIGSDGVELKNLNEFSNKAQKMLESDKAEIVKLKAKINDLEIEKHKLEDVINVLVPSKKGDKA